MRELELNTVEKWYQQKDSAHNFSHVLRVVHMAELLAEEEGADLKIVRTAALLHDVSPDRETHHLGSGEFAREKLQELGWEKVSIQRVMDCIRTHRYRIDDPPSSIEAMCLYDADKLDAIGSVGIARAIAYGAQKDLPFFESPSTTFINSGQLTPEENHSAYHEYLFKLKNIKEKMLTASGKKIARERHAFMENFFEQLRSDCQI
ncbi:MAG: HD domain-containing protein [Anaerolineales bacterium]|nr:HD domain-containing protein [Anaerolineales bacterium]